MPRKPSRPASESETTDPKRGQRSPGQRAGVTADAMLGHAKAIAEREGLEQVTMRRLAAEMGVMPNALYTYFPSKSAILDAVLDSVLGELEWLEPQSGDWKAGVVQLMVDSRALLLRHPRLVPLVLSRPGGRNAIRLGELTLQLLARGGITGHRAVQALRSLLVYTMGFAAVEVPRTTDPDSAERFEGRAALIRGLPESAFPLTRALARDFATLPTDEDFTTGLRWMLDGIIGESPSSLPSHGADDV